MLLGLFDRQTKRLFDKTMYHTHFVCHIIICSGITCLWHITIFDCITPCSVVNDFVHIYFWFFKKLSMNIICRVRSKRYTDIQEIQYKTNNDNWFVFFIILKKLVNIYKLLRVKYILLNQTIIETESLFRCSIYEVVAHHSHDIRSCVICENIYKSLNDPNIPWRCTYMSLSIRSEPIRRKTIPQIDSVSSGMSVVPNASNLAGLRWSALRRSRCTDHQWRPKLFLLRA